MGDRTDADERLSAYLHEHLLGSEGGVRAFRAAARTWRGTSHGPALAALVQEVDRDRRDLARLVRRLGFRPAPWRRALAGPLRALGALGPANPLRLRRASTAQLELDVLTGAVRAKLAMWEALGLLAQHDRRLDAAAIASLHERAERQIEALRRISLATAHERFGRGPIGPGSDA